MQIVYLNTSFCYGGGAGEYGNIEEHITLGLCARHGARDTHTHTQTREKVMKREGTGHGAFENEPQSHAKHSRYESLLFKLLTSR